MDRGYIAGGVDVRPARPSSVRGREALPGRMTLPVDAPNRCAGLIAARRTALVPALVGIALGVAMAGVEAGKAASRCVVDRHAGLAAAPAGVVRGVSRLCGAAWRGTVRRRADLVPASAGVVLGGAGDTASRGAVSRWAGLAVSRDGVASAAVGAGRRTT